MIYFKQFRIIFGGALLVSLLPVYAAQFSHCSSSESVYQGDCKQHTSAAAKNNSAKPADKASSAQFQIIADAAASAQSASPQTSSSKNHTITAEPRAFGPAITYIEPGDTVGWVGMISHNTASVEGLIPEGAKHWRSKLGENIKLKFSIPGIYAYVCEPHIGFGMVGVIVVGKVSKADIEQVTQYARDNLKGPYRRLIGKMMKVKATN